MSDINFHLHPEFLNELQKSIGDVEKFIFEIYLTIVKEDSLSKSTDIKKSFGIFEDRPNRYRALVACAILSSHPSTYPLCADLCHHLTRYSLCAGERYQIAKCYSTLGSFARQSDELESAIECAERGLQVLAELPDREITAILYYNFGIALESQGDFVEATEAFLKSSKIYKQLNFIHASNDARTRANNLRKFLSGSLEETCLQLILSGKKLRQSGDMMGALRVYQVALRAAIRCKRNDLYAVAVNNISTLFFHQGEPNKAVQLLKRAITELEGKLDEGALSGLEAALAEAYSKLEQLDKAIEYFERARKPSVNSENEFEQGVYQHGLGGVYLNTGNLRVAKDYFKRALDFRRRSGEPIRLANTINQLGHIAYKEHNFSLAENFHREALRLRVQENDIRGIAESLGNLAAVYEEYRSEPISELATCLRAARLVEQIRNRIGTGGVSRTSYMDQVEQYYLRVLRLACLLKRQNSAFWAFQRIQNRTLLDSLGRSLVPKPPAVPMHLYIQEQELLKRLRFHKTNQLQVNEIIDMLGILYNDQIFKHAPNYVRLRTGSPMPMHILQQSLANAQNGTAYIEMIEMRERIFGIVAGGPRKQKLTSFYSESHPKSLREPPHFIGKHNFFKSHAEIMLEPYLAQIVGGPGAIFVVPHGDLTRVPFHALMVKGKPLIDYQPVRYLPQGALLEHHLQWDKEFELSSMQIIGDSKNDLAGARREAKRIGKILGVEPVLGHHASRQIIIDALMKKGIFHFSGHAYFNPDEPSRSGLVASDGVITADEINNLEINASLIVLNACESGVQGIGIGSELHGFVRSLMLAGVKYIICTLWRVSDVVAESFSSYFYEALVNQHLHPVEAAHIAQRMLLQKHPKRMALWAPFVFIG